MGLALDDQIWWAYSGAILLQWPSCLLIVQSVKCCGERVFSRLMMCIFPFLLQGQRSGSNMGLWQQTSCHDSFGCCWADCGSVPWSLGSSSPFRRDDKNPQRRILTKRVGRYAVKTGEWIQQHPATSQRD